MKAAVLTDFNKIEIKDVKIPDIKDDEVLVKVKYNGICGTDIHVSQGHHSSAIPPLVMGHEFCGVIDKKGKKAGAQFSIGDRVVVQPYESCGECDACKSGSENVCSNINILGIHRNGAFQEYVNVKASKLFKLDDSIDDVSAALVEPLAIAVHDVRKSGLGVGDSVAIIGGGPIGLLIAIVARINGASKILISEINPSRIKKAEELGFTVFNPVENNLIKESMLITDNKGFDVVFEVSGSKAGNLMMTQLVKISGTVIVVGIPAENCPVDTDSIFKKEIRIMGVRLHSKSDFQTSVKLLSSEENRRYISQLITAQYPLVQINEAFKYLKEGKGVYKILIKIE